MGRAVLIGLGAVFTSVMIGASMMMNFLFGFGFGASVATAWVGAGCRWRATG